MFKENDYVVCEDLQTQQFLLHYANKKGIPIYKLEEDCYDEFPNIAFKDAELVRCNYTSLYNEITIQQFIAYCDNYVQNTVQLNNSYKAIINKDTKKVKVACQTITFEKITELYNLIQ